MKKLEEKLVVEETLPKQRAKTETRINC